VPFKKEEVSVLLAKCHRWCCICHRFCGIKIETDHIILKDDGGCDDIENAIPLCFECRAEVHLYNIGTLVLESIYLMNLRHKEMWINICETTPSILVQSLN
jgi:hypothetical protein